jgi:hypothetical protein
MPLWLTKGLKFTFFESSRFRLAISYNSISLILIGCIGLFIAMPILKTPLGTDDIWMSTLKAHNAYYGISGTEYLVSKSLQFHEIGRLAQLANLIQWLTSFFIDHRLVYKVYLISLNIAVGLLIRKITLQILGKNSRYYANIALLLFIVFGQIKNYYDPRTSIAGVCQFSIISFLFGLIFATDKVQF